MSCFPLLFLGASTIKFSCSVCKATFKSTKTRLHHMKTKHNMMAAAACVSLPNEQPVNQSTPIITPISICQPALLQVEPNGPLQKVDANIDTEQIRKLIESLGNVQKVNQVVILGQVPPHAPPLEVQQIAQLAEPVTLNLSPPQIDFIGLQHSECNTAGMDSSNNPCDSMEQTIILEPITPDGQLENTSFSELNSHIATGENFEVTLIQTEHTLTQDGEVMHRILQAPESSAILPDHADQMVCQNEVADLEQTVILELTPALIPTLELEQSQTVAQNEMLSSSLVLTTDLQKTPDQTPVQTVIEEEETSLSVPPLMPTVELELTPLQTEQQDLSSCSFNPTNTLTQTIQSESVTNPKENNTEMQTVSLDQVQSVMDNVALEETQKTAQEPSETVDSKEAQTQGEKLSVSDSTSTKGEVPPQFDIKQVPQISELPVNVMSAQELVKVRKRKPARAFNFQGYMQELVGSLYKDDLQTDATPAKRQRAKKSHLVVKFGPQSKEKKNKRQKKPSQQHQPTEEEEIQNLQDKTVATQKKGKKVKRDKKTGHFLSTAEIKSHSLPQVSHVQQIKQDARKNKMKKQKGEARENVKHMTEHKHVASPVFKKKKQPKTMQKNQPKSAKDGKRKKNLAKKEKVNAEASEASADITGPHITQDSLLLLKGHKQPQLKVYKLDPSKASRQTQEAPPHDSQTKSQRSKAKKRPTSEPNLTTDGKKKGGRPKKNQKALSLLSSLQVSHQPPETMPTKPKTSRKRKASLKVETEGVITSSHSKRALECKDCGERFSEVSSLQKHKAVVHIVESPGLTYTNGNIFEGVSRLDLYHPPKRLDKVVGVVNTATDWDTEPELGETALEDKERTVCFPALIPSPSLPVPPTDVNLSVYDEKDDSKTVATDQPPAPNNASSTVAPESDFSASTPIKSLVTGEPLETDETSREEPASKHVGSESEGQTATDEDNKEDLLFEVDVVTVGEQNERDDMSSPQESIPQNGTTEDCNSEGGSTEAQADDITTKSLTSQTVSCSTHQVEIKKEAEEELLVQRKREGGRGAGTRKDTIDRRQGTNVIPNEVLDGETVGRADLVKGQDDCQAVYEEHPVNPDSEIHDKSDTGIKTSQLESSPDCEANIPAAPSACLPSTLTTSDRPPDEQVVFELKSVTTNVESNDKQGLQEEEEHHRESDQSPGIILEKIITCRQRTAAEKESCLKTNVRPLTCNIPRTLHRFTMNYKIIVFLPGFGQPC